MAAIPLALRRPAALTVLLGAGSVPAVAQCRPPRSSNEARLLAFYSVPVTFAADPALFGAPGPVLRIAGEAGTVPAASPELRRTEYCYTGRSQQTGLTPLFARPRVAVVLPRGLGLEASYIPGLTLGGATATLASGAAWITRPATRSVLVTLRLHAMRGTVRGAITCPREGLQQSNPEAPCYGERPSRDEFRPNVAGIELVATARPGELRGKVPRVRLAAGVGLNVLRPGFRVGFSDLLGGTDRTTITVDPLRRASAVLAGVIRLSRRCDVTALAFASLGDAATGRVIAGCRIID